MEEERRGTGSTTPQLLKLLGWGAVEVGALVAGILIWRTVGDDYFLLGGLAVCLLGLTVVCWMGVRRNWR